MKMRTIAKVDGFEIWQDMSGSFILNDRQFDTAMDAARSLRSDMVLCGEMIKQVLATMAAHVDGPEAYDAWKKTKSVIVEDGLKELTGADVTMDITHE